MKNNLFFFSSLLMTGRRGGLLFLLLALALTGYGQGVGIGTTTPEPSAALDIQSTTQGLLLPRLSLAQRNTMGTGSLAPPVPGLVIYQTDHTPGLYAYDGAAWVRLGADNLGNHTATQALNLQAHALTGTGADLGAVVGVGVRADGGLNLGQNTRGNNVLLGYQAGQAMTTGRYNLFSGYQSGYSNMTGSYNQFSGYQSGYTNTTGFYNQFSGYQSGYANTTGDDNHFSGFWSGFRNTTGSDNVFSGTLSGCYNTTGSNNTVLGFNSGPVFFAGGLTNATALGANVNLTQSNSLILGNGANVGIGTSAPTAKLDVVGSVKIAGSNVLEFGAGVAGKNVDAGKIGYGTFSSGGALDIVGAGTSNNRVVRVYAENGTYFNGSVHGVGSFNSSDARLKQQVRPLTGALALVQRLRGVRYEWNALGVRRGGQAGAGQVGVLAQELELVLPELVSTGPDGYKAVNYAQLTPVLLEALKELAARNDALQARAASAEATAAAAQAQTARATATLDTVEVRLRRLEAAGGQVQR